MTEKPWREMVAPVVEKCQMAAMLNLSTTFGPTGCATLADVLVRMAKIIDHQLVELEKIKCVERITAIKRMTADNDV